MTKIRTLPIRLAPIAGEACDSWLEALAHRSDVRWREILTAVGIPPNRFGVFTPVVALAPAQAATVSTATGVPVATLHAMTLSTYDRVWLRTAPPPGTVSLGFPWGRLRGSRYCPTCLTESGGRWQLAWRLGWSFACTKHHRLLADCCPGCAGAQRSRACPAHYAPKPGLCTVVTTDADTGRRVRCGTDLTATMTPQLDRTHPIMKAQNIINDIVASGAANFGAFSSHPRPGVHALSDIRQRAAHLLATATRADIATAAGLVQLGVAYDARRARITAPRDSPGVAEAWAAAPYAAIAAVGIAAAIRDLQTRPTSPARQLPTRRRTTAPAAELVALGSVVNPSDELRHRSGPSEAARNTAESSRINDLLRAVPTMLWPAWSLRFALPQCGQRLIRPALSALLLIVDTPLRLGEAAALVDSPLTAHATSRILQRLANRTDWPESRAALGRLSDYLVDNTAPIDYQRRRQLDYTTLLPDNVWVAICRDTGTQEGKSARARLVRGYLYERLSGQLADSVKAWHITGWQRIIIADYPLKIDTELAGHLEQHCRNFLADNGIHDEPPFWSPPADIFDGLRTPGPDPDHVDIARMRRLLAGSDRPPSHTAQRLRTTVDILRYLGERDPAPPFAGSGGGSARMRVKANLPRAEFVRLYCDEKKSLSDIATGVGVSAGVITRLARDYGIELRPPHPLLRRSIDATWLYQQYVINRRTLPDIAAECGMSKINVARWARLHGIPLRSRGTPSHRTVLDAIGAAQNAPKLLRPALTPSGGWDRLQRFAAATNYPTLTIAAKQLGANALVAQTLRLEADLGVQLFDRARRGQPMQLTRDGRRVLAAVRKMQQYLSSRA